MLATAHKKIHDAMGKKFHADVNEGKFLKGKREVMAFAELNATDMKKIGGLIEHGWKVEKAKRFRMTKPTQ